MTVPFITEFESAGRNDTFSVSLSDKQIIVYLRMFSEIFKSVKVKKMIQNLWYTPWRTRSARNLEKKLLDNLIYQILITAGQNDLFESMKLLSEHCLSISEHIKTDDKIFKSEGRVKLGSADKLFETLHIVMDDIDVDGLLQALACSTSLWQDSRDTQDLYLMANKVIKSIFELDRWVKTSNLFANPEQCNKKVHQFLNVAMDNLDDDYFSLGYMYSLRDMCLSVSLNENIYVSKDCFSFITVGDDDEIDGELLVPLNTLLRNYS